MLDCTLLQRGERYLYRGKYLIYEHRIPGVRPQYVFVTDRGATKELSQEIVRRDVWEQITIDTSKFEAFNE